MNTIRLRPILLAITFIYLLFFNNFDAFGQFKQIGKDLLGIDISGYRFGYSTSINQDGSIIAVGTPYKYTIDTQVVNGSIVTSREYNRGEVMVFEKIQNDWVQRGKSILGEAAGDWSGVSIDLDGPGNTIIIGANENDGWARETGHARVYYWNGIDWIQKGNDIDGENVSDESGISVSINASGNIIAIGSARNIGSGSNVDEGHVRVYEWNGSTWTQKGSDIDGGLYRGEFGNCVSLSDDGNVLASSAFDFREGYTAVYDWNGVNWVQRGGYIVGENFHDFAGEHLALDAQGNTIIIGAQNNQTNGIASGKVRVYEWNGAFWDKKGADIIAENERDRFGEYVDISGDGNTIIIGSRFNDDNGSDAGHARVYKWQGQEWVKYGADIDGDAAGDECGVVGISRDGETIILGAPRNSKNNTFTYTGQVRVFSFSKVYGLNYLDLNQNCQQDSFEIAKIKGQNLIINPGNIIVQTDTNDYWYIDSLPVGTYTITTDTNSNNNYQPCAATYTFTVINSDSITQAPFIGYQTTNQCTSPAISINVPFLRPGFSNQKVYIQACNDDNATTILDSAYAVVTLDSLLIVDSISLNYTSLGNNKYRVELDSLYPGQCKSFWLDCTLALTARLGQSICMDAKLYPIDSCALDTITNTVGIPCSTLYDESHLIIMSNCSNDSISFTITNVEGNMSCWSQVRLYIDGILVRIDSVQLQTNQSQVFSFAGDGRTWRMEVDQHPLHPGNSQPSTTIELCGNEGNWTPDLVNILPLNDADPVIDIFCGVVTGSYDPNDKTGFPLGVGVTHDIMPNQKLEYLIRFQNTGTDTAFTVVIRDTLETDFDIFSVQSGVSSHDYTFRMYGPRVLEWTFNNIMLPDSNVNEPLSNGFVKFEVNQQPNLPNGTLLENSAAIYFDFNAPIITNTSVHTINDGLPPPTVIQQNIAASGCDSLELNGYQYYQSGTYYQPVSNGGVDSLYVLDLLIGENSQNTQVSHTACDNITLNGQTYTQSGTYIDTLLNADGCDSILTQNVTIKNTDLTITTGALTLTANQPAAANISYQWIDCNNGNIPIAGANNRVYSPTSNGDYAVQIDNGTCIKTSACTNFTVVSVDRVNNRMDVQLYPNPTTGTLQLQRNTTIPIEVQVINQLGSVLLQQQITQKTATLDLNQLPQGLYFIHIQDGQNKWIEKIVKQ